MKDRNLRNLLNGKGFYMVLFLCVITVVGTAAVMTTNNLNKIQDMNESDEELVDLGSEYGDFDTNGLQQVGESEDTPLTVPENSVADAGAATVEESNPPTIEPIVLPKEEDVTKTKEEKNGEEKVEQKKPETTVEEKKEETEKSKQETASAQTTQNVPLAKPVTNPKPKAPQPVNGYTEGEKMQWPISGEVVMAFSPEKPIYDKTLEQYRTNSAISISANSTTQVKAAASGVVEELINTPETGTTVVIDHGNGWKTTYGQLQEKVLVKKNQQVEKGQVIGGVGKPSKYAVLLGEHLYFKVTKDGNPVDPSTVFP